MKTLKRIIVLTIILAIVFALVGCINPTADTEGEMTLVVGEKVYTVDLSKVSITNGLLSILDYLQANEGLTYETRTDSYGTMITRVDDLKEDTSSSTYLYIYTSVQKDFDVSEWASTKDYNGTTLTSAGVGASLLSVEKDCVILITTITYGG